MIGTEFFSAVTRSARAIFPKITRRGTRYPLQMRRICYSCFAVVIRQIFISPGHNYFGHAGRLPG